MEILRITHLLGTLYDDNVSYVPCFSLVLVKWNCVHLVSCVLVLNHRETTWNSGQMELNNPTCI
jgi:hypothetical protein